MSQTNTTLSLLHNQLSHRKNFVSRLAPALLMLCLCVLFMLSGNTVVFAASIPGGNVSDPVVRAVDIAQPAVVRIVTTISSQLSVRISPTDTITFPQTGSGYPVQLSGSGTFITSQGDIVTADHVVNPPHDKALSQALDQVAASDVATYLNQHAKAGTAQVTSDQVAQELASGQLSSEPSYGKTSSIVFLSTSYTGPLSATSFQSLPQQVYAEADKIEQESPPNQKDIAIIHAPFKDTPSVQLGDSSTVHDQDTLTIIGFPGSGDVSTTPNDFLASSVNKITVSSTGKTTQSGAPVIQVGGNVEHGDSGGPAIDNDGSIVGIVSFGVDTGSGTGGTSFLQASNSARDMVQSLNLDTAPGPFEKLWSQAFNDYAATSAGHWHKAQQELNQLATNYPLFQSVKPYLDYAQTQAQTEKVPATATPGATQGHAPATSKKGGFSLSAIPTTWLLAGAGVGVLLILALLLFALSLGRRKKQEKQPAPQGAATPGLGGPPAAVPAQPFQPMPAPMNAPPQPWNNLRAPATPGAPGAAGPLGASSHMAQPPGIPAAPMQGPAPVPNPVSNGSSTILRAWPCGHMNRPNARFCSVCGEPAPTNTPHVGQ